MVRGRRVAVCFSGQPRFLDKCWPSIKQYLVDPYKADVFGHFWSSFTKLSARELPFVSDTAQFEEHIRFNQDILKQFKYVICEPRIYFDQSLYQSNCTKENSRMQAKSFQNVLSMHYSVWRADQIRQIHQLAVGEYDLVIRCRTDLLFHSNIDWDAIFNTIDLGIVVPDHEHYGGVNDQLAFADGFDMWQYSQCHFNIPALFRAGTNFHPETILRDHLKSKNVTVIPSKIDYTLER